MKPVASGRYVEAKTLDEGIGAVRYNFRRKKSLKQIILSMDFAYASNIL
jgi:hypothetical protein